MCYVKKIIKVETVALSETTFSPTCLVLVDNDDTTYSLYKANCSGVLLHDYKSSLNSNTLLPDGFNIFNREGSTTEDEYADVYFMREVVNKSGKLIDLEEAAKLYPNSELLKPFILAKERDKKIDSLHDEH